MLKARLHAIVGPACTPASIGLESTSSDVFCLPMLTPLTHVQALRIAAAHCDLTEDDPNLKQILVGGRHRGVGSAGRREAIGHRPVCITCTALVTPTPPPPVPLLGSPFQP